MHNTFTLNAFQTQIQIKNGPPPSTGPECNTWKNKEITTLCARSCGQLLGQLRKKYDPSDDESRTNERWIELPGAPTGRSHCL